ncbi:MAG: hypothetical protein KKB25_00935 [Nanoarchaeota archaeon]|nr:hypothetical protein [Nanoarchaeota archaeon]
MTKEEAIINDCKYLGEKISFQPEGFPVLRFECRNTVIGEEYCLFPHKIKNPKCCIMYTSGGEEKVTIAKTQINQYFKKALKNVDGWLDEGRPDILNEI